MIPSIIDLIIQSKARQREIQPAIVKHRAFNLQPQEILQDGMNGTEDWFLINSPLCEVSSSSGVYNPDRDLGEQQHSHTSPITIQSTQTNAVTVELVFVKWDDL